MTEDDRECAAEKRANSGKLGRARSQVAAAARRAAETGNGVGLVAALELVVVRQLVARQDRRACVEDDALFAVEREDLGVAVGRAAVLRVEGTVSG